MRLKGAGIVGIVWLSVLLAGCGGGGSSASSTHTYVVLAHVSGSFASAANGIYMTVVSPVPISTSLLTADGNKVVSQAQGPQRCSYTKTVHTTHGPGAFLNGKKLTFKVNATSPIAVLICHAIKTQPLNASNFMGG